MSSIAKSRRRDIRVAIAALVAFCALAATGGSAHARGKLIDLHAAILGGGMLGGGSGKPAPDFFHLTQGPGFGAEVGLRLLVVDLSIRFVQMLGSHGRQGTLSSIMLGPMVEIPVVDGGQDVQGKPRPPLVVLRPGLSVGFGFGTPAPVNPPLSADQISAKGIMVLGRFAVERMFGPVVGVGAEIQGGYHYFLGKSGVANGNDHSSGWQLAGFGTLSFHFGA